MTEGFSDPSVAARRGRRDPALRDRMEMVDMEQPDDMFVDSGDEQPDLPPLLFEGDVGFFKICGTFEIGGQPTWITGGAQSRLQADEDPFDMGDRLKAFAITQVREGVLTYMEMIGSSADEFQQAEDRLLQLARRNKTAPRR